MDRQSETIQPNYNASVLRAICFGMSDAMVLSYALATGLHWAGANAFTVLFLPGGTVVLGAIAMGWSGYSTQKEQLEENPSATEWNEKSNEPIETYWPDASLERKTALDLSWKERREWSISLRKAGSGLESPFVYGLWVGVGHLIAGATCLMPFLFSHYALLSGSLSAYVSLGILVMLALLRTLSLNRGVLSFFRYPVLGLFAAACVYFVARIFLSAP